MLKIIITLPILGILLIQIYPPTAGEKIGRIIGMIISIITMYVSLYMLIIMNNNNAEYQFRQYLDLDYIRLTIGVDGISMSLIIVTTILMPILILLKERTGREETNEIIKIILVMESMLIFLFSSLDIFFFFLFFELLLIPMFLLIGKFGSKEKRVEAAYRFIGVSMMGSLIMLISIIILYVKIGTTNNELLMIKLYNLSGVPQFFLALLWLALFFSFAIKVPIFPFHTWLPFVHVEAPTIGSMLLAGIMLKLGTYGLIRYTISMLGDINDYFTPIVFIMGVLSIIYGSLTTIRQIDLKKIIAYSSIVHMNYTIIGYYTNEIEGLNGGNYLMISHAFVSCGLFLLIGIIYKRYHSRIIMYYSGLVLTMPLYATFLILFTLGNVSLPLTSSFISEILVIISTLKFNFFVAFLISFSLLFSTTYGIWLANRLLFGDFSKYIEISKDLTKTEIIALLPLIILTIILGINTNIILGIYSFPVLNLLY